MTGDRTLQLIAAHVVGQHGVWRRTQHRPGAAPPAGPSRSVALCFHILSWCRQGSVRAWLQYTWDKQLETWVKSTGILAGGKEPTVISPKQYLRRFRAAMSSYFTLVPGFEPPQPRRSPDA